MKCFYCNRRIKRKDKVKPYFVYDQQGQAILYGIYTHDGHCNKGMCKVFAALADRERIITSVRDIRRGK